MMSAGMGHAGFRYGKGMLRAADAIQFTDQADSRAGGAKCCFYTGYRKSGLGRQAAAVCQPVGNLLCGTVLCITCFRMGINIMGKCSQLRGVGINVAADALFNGIHRITFFLSGTPERYLFFKPQL